MIVGFTGTRDGMTESQIDQLALMLVVFKSHENQFHFGGSGRSDLRAREIAKSFGFAIHWHPCPGISLASLGPLVEEATAEHWRQVFPPLVRNRNIVAAVNVLIAAPNSDDEELRSGTWATTRYAHDVRIPVVHLSRGKRRRSPR